ncbi:hypothetical protein GCK32_001159 [Trichostrongylus colubriformis]|uniref:Uncharacterized protein n=1 Tax=Trichostrongylus colubriformis TaxID=6319 RepID=A0AAN8FKG5_TRICO
MNDCEALNSTKELTPDSVKGEEESGTNGDIVNFDGEEPTEEEVANAMRQSNASSNESSPTDENQAGVSEEDNFEGTTNEKRTRLKEPLTKLQMIRRQMRVVFVRFAAQMTNLSSYIIGESRSNRWNPLMGPLFGAIAALGRNVRSFLATTTRTIKLLIPLSKSRKVLLSLNR